MVFLMKKLNSELRHIFHEFLEINGPSAFSRGDFSDYVLSHHRDDLIEECFEEIICSAIAHHFGTLVRKRIKVGGGFVAGTFDLPEQLEIEGLTLPEYLTLKIKDASGEYVRKPVMKGTIAEMRDQHMAVLRENVIRCQQQLEHCEDSIRTGLHISNGDDTWTWGQVANTLRATGKPVEVIDDDAV